MEIVLHMVAANSVLLLNGAFAQSANAVRYAEDEPLFVTVLPLEAMFLPYTVCLIGGVARSNESLAVCCDMGNRHRYVEFKPRYAYVYSPSATLRDAAPVDPPAQLLAFVAAKNFAAARTLLTPSLSDSVSDAALADFFDGVLSLRKNTFTKEGGYLMIRADGTAPACTITLSGGLIDNIAV